MFPEDSIQHLFDSWWVPDATNTICRGRVLDAFLPHVDQDPTAFIVEGRKDSAGHDQFNFRIEPLTIRTRANKPAIPVAALPLHGKEVHTICKSKVRRVLVVSAMNAPVPMAHGAPVYQTAPTIQVAPYYGVDASGARAGWNPEFVRRIRLCEYPQYMWDMVPDSLTEESILRLDHVQPLIRWSDCYRVLPYRLSDDALEVLEDWQEWYRTGRLNPDGFLAMVRDGWMQKEIGFIQQVEAPS